MNSTRWPPKYVYEEHRTNRDELRGLLAQADRLLADARVAGVSTPSRHALAHNAVVLLAKLALVAQGWRTTESHHYWAIESLRHTVGLSDDEVDVLQAHRSKRHDSSYSHEPAVSEDELDDLLAEADALRARVLAWLRCKHAELWELDAE